MENKNLNWFTSFALIAGSFVLGWQGMALGWFGAEGVSDGGTVVIDEQNSDLGLFWKVWEELERKYVDVDQVSDEDRVYGAIKGMVESVNDPYTVYMTPKETADFTASLDGELEGIGAELTVEDGKLVVVTPLKESPAEKAGLLPKDIIFKIEGKSAVDMSLFDAIMKIRGEKGTPVTLTIIREGEDPFDVSIVRDKIEIESVTVEKLEGDITYIAVNQFNDRTNKEFGRAISEMLLDEPKGMIVDLRYNGGGYLDIAVELLSYVLPEKSDAVIIKERGKKDEILKTNGNPKILNVPLVVLVNEASASASEIFAGAVQDHDRGIVMGAKTFGKGSVQEVESFVDGSSLRLTIAKWFTPDDRTIDKVGLEPDIVVEITEEDREAEFDRQKEEAAKYLREL